MLTTLYGCGTLQERLTAAAETTGKAAAEDALPNLPAECYRDVPHAALVEGMEARSAIAMERRAKSNESASKRRCVSFYGNLKAAREKT